MDSTMDFDAPRSSLFFFSPRLAASAAPAAICWAFYLAGMILDLPRARGRHRHRALLTRTKSTRDEMFLGLGIFVTSGEFSRRASKKNGRQPRTIYLTCNEGPAWEATVATPEAGASVGAREERG